MNNPLAMKSGDVFPGKTIPPVTDVRIPFEVAQWLHQFFAESWSGSLTLHFNRGVLSSYEPKPNLRTIAK